jgi:hypothetical protein|tara:strand:+ start:411 stop:713 length:303 start_codon:yes stop_codon:yes gene_type:complete
MLSLLFLLACEETQQQPSHFQIPSEAYDWNCYDYTEHSEIEITAGVCNELESMTVSILLIDSESVEEDMYHEGGCWWSSLILQEENCIEIQEIIIIGEEK